MNAKKKTYFEDYPLRIVFFSNLVSLLIYLIGAFIIYQIGLAWLILYFIFIGILEFRLISRHCVNCYYYGRVCAFGKGKICSIFFEQGDLNEFCRQQLTWKDIAPDFMVSLIPAVIGIILLIKDFSLLLLSLVISLFVLTFAGNAMVRGKFACRFCKQGQIGCPAQKLFGKVK
jgi:hypothetical protein